METTSKQDVAPPDASRNGVVVHSESSGARDRWAHVRSGVVFLSYSTTQLPTPDWWLDALAPTIELGHDPVYSSDHN